MSSGICLHSAMALEKVFVLGVVWFHNFNINLQILFSNCFLEDFHLIVQNVLLIWPCIRDIVDDSLQHNQFVKLAFHISYFLYMEVLQVGHQNIHSHIYHEKKFTYIRLLHAFHLLRNVQYLLLFQHHRSEICYWICYFPW